MTTNGADPGLDVGIVGVYILIAVGYAVSGYAGKTLETPDGQPRFNPAKFGKTVLVGLVAGIIMAYQGTETTAGEIELAMAIAIPIVDEIWNGLSHRFTS